MGGEFKRTALIAVLVFATSACDDNNVAGPTKAGISSRPSISYGSVTTTNGVTFVGSSGFAMTCSIDTTSTQGPIPVLGNPVPPLGNPIPLLVNPAQTFGAVAIFSPPSISLNFAFFQPLPQPVQAFVFFRECARFSVTHQSGPTFFNSGNCWTIRRLREMNLFGPAEQAAIQKFLEQTFPFATAAAPSGADQWRQMNSCR